MNPRRSPKESRYESLLGIGRTSSRHDAKPSLVSHPTHLKEPRSGCSSDFHLTLWELAPCYRQTCDAQNPFLLEKVPVPRFLGGRARSICLLMCFASSLQGCFFSYLPKASLETFETYPRPAPGSQALHLGWRTFDFGPGRGHDLYFWGRCDTFSPERRRLLSLKACPGRFVAFVLVLSFFLHG